MSGITSTTVLGRDVGEAIIEAGLRLQGTGLHMTGEPVRTASYRPDLSTSRAKVWLWKVPVTADEEEQA